MGVMTMAEKIIVTAAGLLLVAGVNWYFLLSGRKKPRRR
jgi:plastocyanin domain-containing protein